jgi:hypothetical protein
VGIAVVFLIIAAGFGSAVLYLWNWLMPDIFGLKPITYWQALGLMGLSWILFRAGFLGTPRRYWGPPHGTEQGRGLTPEQRERFRQGLECRGAAAADSGPTQSVP